MFIEFDHDVMPNGYVTGTHFIDTDSPAVIAMLTALKGNAAAQAQAGYGSVSKHKLANAAETRWQFLIRQINGPNGPVNLKALNLL